MMVMAEGIDDHQKFFQSGKAAFYIGGTWGTGALEQTDGLNFGAQPFHSCLTTIPAGQILIL